MILSIQGPAVFFVKGAMERILAMCTQYYYRGGLLPMTAKDVEIFTTQAHKMGAAGLRGMLPWYRCMGLNQDQWSGVVWGKVQKSKYIQWSLHFRSTLSSRKMWS